MGGKSGGGSAKMPSPTEYIPLVNAQAQANRVNTFTPYGSTVFSAAPQRPGTAPGGNSGNAGRPNVRPASSSLDFGDGPLGNLINKKLAGSPELKRRIRDMQRGSGEFGVKPMQSVTSFSPELQRLFEQQTGMAGFGDNYNQDFEQASFKRAMNLLEPGFEQQTRDFQQSMSDRGLPVGGEAYDDEFANIQRAQNSSRENAALSAVLSGHDAALRDRGQRFNELSSILGNNQVTPTSPVDVMGPANMAMNGAMNNAQNKQAKKSSATNAGTGLGAAAIMASDRRLKENEVIVGEFMPGINIYKANYIGDPKEMLCFMSDEVKKIFPEAVVTRPDGYEMVNYGFLLNG